MSEKYKFKVISTSDVFKNCLFEKLRRLLVKTLVVLTQASSYIHGCEVDEVLKLQRTKRGQCGCQCNALGVDCTHLGQTLAVHLTVLLFFTLIWGKNGQSFLSQMSFVFLIVVVLQPKNIMKNVPFFRDVTACCIHQL